MEHFTGTTEINGMALCNGALVEHCSENLNGMGNVASLTLEIRDIAVLEGLKYEIFKAIGLSRIWNFETTGLIENRAREGGRNRVTEGERG